MRLLKFLVLQFAIVYPTFSQGSSANYSTATRCPQTVSFDEGKLPLRAADVLLGDPKHPRSDIMPEPSRTQSVWHLSSREMDVYYLECDYGASSKFPLYGLKKNIFSYLLQSYGVAQTIEIR